MCGIVGEFHFGGCSELVNDGRIVAMRDALTHRGPDGSGLWISEDRMIGFGHRRLKIVDLSDTATQPMCNADGSLWITFNGEIYNHLEVRKELQQKSRYRWKTDHSDTEVLLHAFEEWGIGCLEKLRGMFAFALWDDRQKELFLVRDRLGIKPLYYCVHNQRVSFASEIKALLQDPTIPRRVNEIAIHDYLNFLTVPAPDTLFEGIKKIPCGMWMRIRRDGGIEENRYWDLWQHTSPLTIKSQDEIANKLIAELRQSVQIHKLGDVPVGVFLSGGIDSSTNAALFAENETEPVNTFTIGYHGTNASYPNELGYAKQLAAYVGSHHHELLLSLDDLIGFLDRMVYLQDEPIADPVCVPLYFVSKLARDNGVIVCQVGEGSDELFCGYPDWLRYINLENYSSLPVPNLLKKGGLALLQMIGKERSHWYEWLRRSANSLPVFWGGAESFYETEKTQLLSTRLRKQHSGYSSWVPLEKIHSRYIDNAWEQTPLTWMTYLDLNLRLPELLLMRVDKMSMGVSLECRVPFLDHKFVELAMSIPTSVKLDHRVSKPILKKAVRGVIPDNLIDRKKQGFGLPMHEWFFDRLGHYIHETVNNFLARTDYFDPKYVESLFERKHYHKLWLIFNFVLWHEMWIEGTPKHDIPGVPTHKIDRATTTARA